MRPDLFSRPGIQIRDLEVVLPRSIAAIAKRSGAQANFSVRVNLLKVVLEISAQNATF